MVIDKKFLSKEYGLVIFTKKTGKCILLILQIILQKKSVMVKL